LNRQVLFNIADISRLKVDAAKDALKHHCLRTEIVTHNVDAVVNWGLSKMNLFHCAMILVNKISYHHLVVASAREATVIFNAIDYGESFDIAVQSLCLALGIPYVSASSYAYTALAEYFTSKKVRLLSIAKTGMICGINALQAG
jgi:molybdopterin/thiamine biosynthesis adenylyltransferase